MNHLITLKIERLSDEGRGIGFDRGQTVFVSGALPGEVVTARVVGKKKKVLFAEQETLLEASTDRVVPECQHFSDCGGCSLQHMSVSAQRLHRQNSLLSVLMKFAKTQPEKLESSLHGEAWAYRQRCRLSLSSSKSGVTLGYRQAKSHETLSIESCPILDPQLLNMLTTLQRLWVPLLKGRCKGELKLATDGQRNALCMDDLAISPEQRALLQTLAQQQGWLVHTNKSNDSQPLQWRIPSEALVMDYWANDFTQVNQTLNDGLVERAMQWLDVQPEQRILDLFCGVGNFSLAIARRGATVLGVEGDIEMTNRAEINAQQNQLENCDFVCRDLYAEDLNLRSLIKNPDAILLDPPRAGLKTAIKAVIKLKAPKIVYISCDPVTLARDAALLCDAGYTLQKASTIDFFSHTEHSEAITLFIR